MSDEFQYDVFLSHSAKDMAVVRPLAERLRADGVKVWFDEWVLRPSDSIERNQSKTAKTEEGLGRSRALVLCRSAHAFGSDWVQLESGTFRFRDLSPCALRQLQHPLSKHLAAPIPPVPQVAATRIQRGGEAEMHTPTIMLRSCSLAMMRTRLEPHSNNKNNTNP